MKLKKHHHTLLVILIVIVVIVALVSHFPKVSNQELSIFGSSEKMGTDVTSTSISKISEDAETITYRFNWLTNDYSSPTCNSQKSLNLNFVVGDYENPNSKILMPNNVQNQFDVEGDVVLTGLKSYQYPCEDNQKTVPLEIRKNKAVCHLVNIQNKPVISCTIDVALKSQVPVNYYGSINGYADIVFDKEVRE